jgi:hypothetical protein
MLVLLFALNLCGLHSYVVSAYFTHTLFMLAFSLFFTLAGSDFILIFRIKYGFIRTAIISQRTLPCLEFSALEQ